MADIKSLQELTQKFLCLYLHTEWKLMTVKTKMGESGNYSPTHQTERQTGELNTTQKFKISAIEGKNIIPVCL